MGMGLFTKVTKLHSEEGIKRNALKLMENAINSLVEGGSSFENFYCYYPMMNFGYRR